MNRTRVLVVDDSDVCRSMIAEELEAESDIVVVGYAAHAEEARRAVVETKPDLVTMDVALPNESGLAVTRWVMAHHPRPVLVLTGQPAPGRSNLAFEAIRCGALDLVAKPDRTDAEAWARLRAQVRELAKVPVVRHVSMATSFAEPLKRAGAVPGGLRVVGIGASAGGPSAVARILQDLPFDLAMSIAVVQHLPPGFADGFADFLRASTHWRIEVVRGQTKVAHAVAYVAPDDRHLVATPDGMLTTEDGPPVDGHRPSITRLFRSLAEVYGARAVGVVLTGIGTDGAAGIVALRTAGAHTIAQDAATSVVYGMPAAAVRSGAVQSVLSLDTMAHAIRRCALEGWSG